MMIQFLQNYDIRDDFDIVNFPFLDGDVPRRPSYRVYIYIYICIYIDIYISISTYSLWQSIFAC